MILRKETETLTLNRTYKNTWKSWIRMNDTPQGDGNLFFQSLNIPSLYINK